MAARSNSFEGGTNGATVSAAGSGGASGDAFFAVTVTAGGAMAYDNTRAAHGTLSAKVTGGVAGAIACYYDITASARFGVRAYFWFTGLPTDDLLLISMYAADHTTRLLSWHINGAGKLRLSDASGTAGVWTAAAAAPLNQWVRLELYGLCGSTTTNATIKGGVFLGDSTTPIEAIYSSTAGNLGISNQFGRAVVGKPGGTLFATPYWIDDIKADDTATGLLGPFVTFTVTNSQADAAVVTATGTPVAGGTLAYSIAQTSGTTTTPLLVSTGRWAIPRHVTDTLTYTVTVTESPSGLTAPSTVNVAPQGATGGDAVMIRNATNTAWL